MTHRDGEGQLYSPLMPESPRVLRSDDPAGDALLAAGWSLDAISWGARLRLGGEEIEKLTELVRAHREQGVDVEELTVADAPEVAALESVTFSDYPQTQATYHEPLTETDATGLFTDGRVFGIRHHGELVAVTATSPEGDLIETHFTSVHPAHRRQGLATAVKAASVLANAEAGHTWFGTGGAGTNAGSIGMNEAVGYEITETWHTLVPPSQTHDRVPS